MPCRGVLHMSLARCKERVHHPSKPRAKQPRTLCASKISRNSILSDAPGGQRATMQAKVASHGNRSRCDPLGCPREGSRSRAVMCNFGVSVLWKLRRLHLRTGLSANSPTDVQKTLAPLCKLRLFVNCEHLPACPLPYVPCRCSLPYTLQPARFSCASTRMGRRGSPLRQE